MQTNYIKCGDNVKLMKTLPNECIDLTVTSPPYDNLREYNGFDWDLDSVVNELYRITKWGVVVVWITNDATIQGSESCSSFIHALTFKLAGFNVHDTMIWYKDSFSFPDPTRYRQCFEYMFVFSKGKPKSIHLISDRQNKCAGIRVHGTSRLPDGTTFRKSNDKKSLVKNIGVRFNVWEMPSEKHNIYGHPAVFPEQLATDHILSWSSEGDLVFDPFCGSGTTCLSAIKNKRQYIGFDISQTYCDIANKRLFSERIFVEGWDCWNKEEK